MSLKAAQLALEFWGIEAADLKLVAQRENSVFRATARSSGQYALRLHRPGYHTVAAITSELGWMAALHSSGLPVPQPVASSNGALLREISGFQVDLLTWLDGVLMGKTGQPLALADRAGTYRNIGQNMAKIHMVSDNWKQPEDFYRPSWDLDGLLGEAPLWGRFWENPALTDTQHRLLIETRDRASSGLQSCAATLDYGLIHADLIWENVLISPNGVQIIDFDDCGFGYRLFDVATTLLRIRAEPDFNQLSQALFDGYRSERPLDTTQLQLFMVLRALTYVGWIASRIKEPGAEKRCQVAIKTATDLAGHFLSGDEYA